MCECVNLTYMCMYIIYMCVYLYRYYTPDWSKELVSDRLSEWESDWLTELVKENQVHREASLKKMWATNKKILLYII